MIALYLIAAALYGLVARTVLRTGRVEPDTLPPCSGSVESPLGTMACMKQPYFQCGNCRVRAEAIRINRVMPFLAALWPALIPFGTLLVTVSFFRALEVVPAPTQPREKVER